MANKKITDATTATSVAGTDKVFLNQGGDLKQVDLNSAVANSQAVQTLNSNLTSDKGQIIVPKAGTYDLRVAGKQGIFIWKNATIPLGDAFEIWAINANNQYFYKAAKLFESRYDNNNFVTISLVIVDNIVKIRFKNIYEEKDCPCNYVFYHM